MNVRALDFLFTIVEGLHWISICDSPADAYAHIHTYVQTIIEQYNIITIIYMYTHIFIIIVTIIIVKRRI